MVDPISLYPLFTVQQIFPPTGGGGGDVIAEPDITITIDDNDVVALIDDTETVELVQDDLQICHD